MKTSLIQCTIIIITALLLSALTACGAGTSVQPDTGVFGSGTVVSKEAEPRVSPSALVDSEPFPENQAEQSDAPVQPPAATPEQTQAVEQTTEPVTEITAESLVGLWQASSVLGSGWDERLLLEENGDFYWAESQMDATARIRFKHGWWEFDGEELILNVTDTLKWEGGEVEDSTIYVGGELTDYTVKWQIDHRLPQAEFYYISAGGYDTETERDTIGIGDYMYWRYESQDDIQQIKDDFNAMLDVADPS